MTLDDDNVTPAYIVVYERRGKKYPVCYERILDRDLDIEDMKATEGARVVATKLVVLADGEGT
jgi:hypothetical protein